MNRVSFQRAAGALAVLALVSGSALASLSIVPSAVPFVDISSTGTSIGTISDDSETTVSGINWVGNGLLAGNVAIRIGNNGAVLWGNSAADTFAGATEVGFYNAGPNNTAQNSISSAPALNTASGGNGNGIRQFIAPLWDDYTPIAGGATTRILYQVINDDLYIQWNREDAFAAPGSGDVTFQAVFRGNISITSGQSLVDYVYQDTLFAPNAYQNDGGSATIGFKNWGINPDANDVEFGIGGGGTSALSDPAFGGLGQQPKVSGWVAGADSLLPRSVSIVPAPGAIALAGLGGLLVVRRRRA